MRGRLSGRRAWSASSFRLRSCFAAIEAVDRPSFAAGAPALGAACGTTVVGDVRLITASPFTGGTLVKGSDDDFSRNLLGTGVATLWIRREDVDDMDRLDVILGTPWEVGTLPAAEGGART